MSGHRGSLQRPETWHLGFRAFRVWDLRVKGVGFGGFGFRVSGFRV